MSRAGNPPVDTVGVVDIYAPTSNPYYGLMIDRFEMKPGELMAVGGWENIATVENRYYKSGQEHEERALERVERG